MLKNVVIGFFTMNFALLVHGDPITVGLSSEYSGSNYYLKGPKCKDEAAVLCQEVEGYPIDLIMLGLENRRHSEVRNLYGEKDYVDNICQTVIEDTKPQAAYNAENVFTYIINVENVYTQVVRRETCVGKNSTCDNVVSVAGYKSYCQQTYTLQSLLAFDSFFQVTIDYFKIPSGCCCTTMRS